MANENDAVSPPESLSVTITLPQSRLIEGSGGGTPFLCTITRAGDTSEQQLVFWHAYGSGEHPISLSELDATIGTVLFAPGETTRTFTLYTTADFAVEPDEGFTISAYDRTTETDYGTAARGTIVDDDTKIAITVQAPALREGSVDGQGAEFVFELTRSGDLSGTQVLPWTVHADYDNGLNASDFAGGVLPSGTVTFAPGETHKTIAIKVAPDTDVESAESFTVELPNMVGVIDGPNYVSAAILNDDATVELHRLSDQAEGDSGTTNYTFELIRRGDISLAHSVSWTVSAYPQHGPFPDTLGYSADAADFVGGIFPSGTVTFDPGEMRKTFTVPVAGDTLSETSEEFQIQLSNPSDDLAIKEGWSWGYITNDDPLPVVAHDDSYVTLEGGKVGGLFGRGVEANDIGATAISILSGPSHGTLEQWVPLSGFTVLTYRPDAGFHGIDTFTYRANGPDGSDEAQVTIHVVPVIHGATPTLNLLALTPEEQVAAAYVAFAGRAADAAGFAFWINEFHTGLPTQGPKMLLANIASSFAISEEAKGLYSFLANPGTASDGDIHAFLDGVYHNLFNRSVDAGGLAYWTGQVHQKLAGGEFVGSVLVDIMSGAQDAPSGLAQSGNVNVIVFPGPTDLEALMGKVAVSLEFVHSQQEHGMAWNGPADITAATDLLRAVQGTDASILLGVKNGEDYVLAHG